ncbi:biopolymer transporter ExbD [bacterium]|nr:biopolymer transporter ExbD [bacterium]
MAGQRKTFNEINITPLTDIFLVLLIIMMVIAPLLDQQGLNLAVPNMIEVQDEIKDSKLIKILVDDNDKYFIDDVEIASSDLANVITEQAQENTDGLLIMTQDNATHGAVVKLMDEARNVGVTNISITEY